MGRLRGVNEDMNRRAELALRQPALQGELRGGPFKRDTAKARAGPYCPSLTSTVSAMTLCRPLRRGSDAISCP